jgi:hypothetical protein
MSSGISQAIELHERIVVFRNALVQDFDRFDHSRNKTSLDSSDPEFQAILIRFTIYGIYLQVKMMVLVPLLQFATWQAVGSQSLVQSDQMKCLVAKCIHSAYDMVCRPVAEKLVADVQWRAL